MGLRRCPKLLQRSSAGTQGTRRGDAAKRLKRGSKSCERWEGLAAIRLLYSVWGVVVMPGGQHAGGTWVVGVLEPGWVRPKYNSLEDRHFRTPVLVLLRDVLAVLPPQNPTPPCLSTAPSSFEEKPDPNSTGLIGL